jgi:3-dehydroquinate dehydratase-2
MAGRRPPGKTREAPVTPARPTRLAPALGSVLGGAPIPVSGRIHLTPPLIAVLNGPNLNLLGTRQPEIYGSATLDDVEALCAETADALDLAIDFRQTNAEGELITWVQECRGRAAGIIINPAGYSHTSVALMDALKAMDVPVVEVHISNIHRREEFRHHSYVSRAATGVIAGLGIQGYALALRAMAELLAEQGEP